MGTNAVPMPVPGYGAPGRAVTRHPHEDELYYLIFFVFMVAACTGVRFPLGEIAGISDVTTSTQRGCKAAFVLWRLSLPPPGCVSCSKAAAVSRSGQAAQLEMCSSWVLSLLSFSLTLLCYKAHLRDGQPPPSSFVLTPHWLCCFQKSQGPAWKLISIFRVIVYWTSQEYTTGQ